MTKPIEQMSTEELFEGFPRLAKDVHVEQLTDDQLARYIEHYRRNVARAHPVTYEGALNDVVLPEVIRRLRTP